MSWSELKRNKTKAWFYAMIIFSLSQELHPVSNRWNVENLGVIGSYTANPASDLLSPANRKASR